MRIYGADFSGSKSLPHGIYYCAGRLRGSVFFIEEVIQSDDRLDLYSAIVKSKAPWGLDFPFSFPISALKKLDISNWRNLIGLSLSKTRVEYLTRLNERIPRFEGRCIEHNIYCRHTDMICGAQSPLKQVNPPMRTMMYAGLKLLGYLREKGAAIYPFDRPEYASPRIYELYPSHTWTRVGLPRSLEMDEFVDKFNGLNILEANLPEKFRRAENQDMADSIAACVTLAACIHMYGIDRDWYARPSFALKSEWEAREKEGLIIRI